MKALALIFILSASILVGCNKEEEKVVVNEVGAGIDIESITGWWNVKTLNTDQTEISSIFIAPIDRTPGITILDFTVTNNGEETYFGQSTWTGDEKWNAYIATKEGNAIYFKDKETGATIIKIESLDIENYTATIVYKGGTVTNVFEKEL